MTHQLAPTIRDQVRMHRHCFNGSQSEVDHWRKEFPNIKGGFIGFGFTELDDVVKLLPMEDILLESDSPYLQAPVHKNINTTCLMG